MEINWFTVIAQIINFVILLWLLKRFLFDRIIAAMDKREEEISNQLREADEKQRQAEEQEASFRAEKEKLEKQRNEKLQEAQKQADQKRHDLVTQARSEVDSMKEKWQHALDNEREAFMQSMREAVSGSFFAISKRALKDLANAELQEQIVWVFLEKIQEAEAEVSDVLKKAARKDDKDVRLVSTFELEPDMKEKIKSVLDDVAGRKISPQYEVDEALICGIELHAHGYKLGWNMQEYLDEIETEVGERISNLRVATSTS